ncbi:hypothetical protein FRACYDRAFT_254189 [Fragilariopsis cylindrus CCMP1102]|uniref:Uncharacterized protein n=1 Tax=Fragilariopsis cylindrus CCMP1102 TaxID=635003 RepID=A0A1E7EL57_9STRA|nr:hypothetical protein FRACYDRAFT_254189 [Fragilariopsis cylindrus CCMP1102]|eukprot:OEU06638.1 hypothetical protein FRACYDRAFT_254189 [Fragilariopsis cylindrus CCMP1102]
MSRHGLTDRTPREMRQIKQKQKVIKEKANDTSTSTIVLPDWIIDYITWHTKQRTLYKDIELLTNPNAPSILIHYSDQYSEGLAGRFTKINRLLWFAYDRKLLLLIVFYDSPMPLETFLIPPSIDTMNQEFKSNIGTWNWTVPILQNKTDTAYNVIQNYESVFGKKKKKRKNRIGKKEKARKVNTKESSELDTIVSNRKRLFFDKNEIVRIGQSGHINIRLDRIPYHIDNNKSNTTTTTTTTGPGYIPFSSYWRLFFQPSIELQHRLDNTYQELNLIKHTNNNNNSRKEDDENDSKNENQNENQLYKLIVYDAIHCRIRHPAHHNIITHEMEYDLFDKERRIIDMNIDVDVNTTISSSMSLLDWKHQKENAIRTANHAVQCSNWLTSSMTSKQADVEAEQAELELVYLLEGYYSTFIDLYIASNARCITMGVGRFAYLASRISSSSSSSNSNDGSKKCVQLHEKHSEDIMKRWGFHSGIFNIIQQCPI